MMWPFRLHRPTLLGILILTAVTVPLLAALLLLHLAALTRTRRAA